MSHLNTTRLQERLILALRYYNLKTTERSSCVMIRKKKVKAIILEIVSSVRHEEIVRDYDAEYYADLADLYYSPVERWTQRISFHGQEHEDNVYELANKQFCYRAKGTFGWREMELYRELTWYVIKLKILYFANGVSFEKLISIRSNIPQIDAVTVYYDKRNPQSIVSIMRKREMLSYLGESISK